MIGTGPLSDRLLSRPAVNVLGIDAPSVVASSNQIVPRARARVSLRLAPGDDPVAGRDALVAHLRAAAPWGVHVTVEREAIGAPFQAASDGPAYRAMGEAMQEAYGRPMARLGQGGSIPLCNVFDETYPGAELILMGVEEPLALIHAPNESVDPAEIEAMALAEALFLKRYAMTGA
jgi:acetylornithine deacetylase/succinyl-diaminopimelate desuccinylase-like protein